MGGEGMWTSRTDPWGPGEQPQGQIESCSIRGMRHWEEEETEGGVMRRWRTHGWRKLGKRTLLWAKAQLLQWWQRSQFQQPTLNLKLHGCSCSRQWLEQSSTTAAGHIDRLGPPSRWKSTIWWMLFVYRNNRYRENELESVMWHMIFQNGTECGRLCAGRPACHPTNRQTSSRTRSMTYLWSILPGGDRRWQGLLASTIREKGTQERHQWGDWTGRELFGRGDVEWCSQETSMPTRDAGTRDTWNTGTPHTAKKS